LNLIRVMPAKGQDIRASLDRSRLILRRRPSRCATNNF